MGLRSAAAVAAVGWILVLGSGTARAAGGCPGDQTLPTIATTQQTLLALACDIETARVANGVAPLRWNWTLFEVAEGQATDMAQHHYVGHVSSDGRDLPARIGPTGYLNGVGSFAFENVQWATGLYDSPAMVTAAWLGSPQHRANMLDPNAREMAVTLAHGAPALGAPDGVFYVAEFGNPGVREAHAACRARIPPWWFLKGTTWYAQSVHRTTRVPCSQLRRARVTRRSASRSSRR